MNQQLAIGGVQKLSTIDYPGKLACVLFLRGCNMDCFYCHNRDLLSFAGCTLDLSDCQTFLQKRVGLLEGVVVTGGEPLIQESLPDFLRYLKDLGYAIKLDTNGLLPQRLQAVLAQGLVDFVALDVKSLPEDYACVCKTAAHAWERIYESLLLLLKWEADPAETKRENVVSRFEVRTTLYPGFRREDLLDLARLLPTLPSWRLNLFRTPKNLPDKEDGRSSLFTRTSLTIDELNQLKEELQCLQPCVFWQ